MATTDEIKVALDELRATFPDSSITIEESGDGGAWVCVDPVPTGNAFIQGASWIAFHIPYTYPDADIYPLFVRPDLARKDGGAHTGAIQQPIGFWAGGARNGTQLSRRTPEVNGETNTAASKVMKVLRWLSEQ